MNANIAVTQYTIAAEAAVRATQAAVAQAESLKLRINVAVVDRAGLLVAFLRMPGAALHSIDLAIDKAYTAASFGRSTGDWPQVLAERSAAVREGLPRRPRFVIMAGGLPIVVDGERVGAIGVSGAYEQQDEVCASAGLAAIAAA